MHIKHEWSAWEPLHKLPIKTITHPDGHVETIYMVETAYSMCLHFPCTKYMLMDEWGEFETW